MLPVIMEVLSGVWSLPIRTNSNQRRERERREHRRKKEMKLRSQKRLHSKKAETKTDGNAGHNESIVEENASGDSTTEYDSGSDCSNSFDSCDSKHETDLFHHDLNHPCNQFVADSCSESEGEEESAYASNARFSERTLNNNDIGDQTDIGNANSGVENGISSIESISNCSSGVFEIMKSGNNSSVGRKTKLLNRSKSENVFTALRLLPPTPHKKVHMPVIHIQSGMYYVPHIWLILRSPLGLLPIAHAWTLKAEASSCGCHEPNNVYKHQNLCRCILARVGKGNYHFDGR